MATNFRQPGRVWDYTAGGTITAGSPVLMSDVLGVALEDAVSGDVIPVAVTGVWSIACLSTDEPAIGAPLYWDAGNSRLTTTASTHKLAGYAAAAKASGATTAYCALKLGAH